MFYQTSNNKPAFRKVLKFCVSSKQQCNLTFSSSQILKFKVLFNKLVYTYYTIYYLCKIAKVEEVKKQEKKYIIYFKLNLYPLNVSRKD